LTDTFDVEAAQWLVQMLGVVIHLQLHVAQREEANLEPLHRHLLAPASEQTPTIATFHTTGAECNAYNLTQRNGLDW